MDPENDNLQPGQEDQVYNQLVVGDTAPPGGTVQLLDPEGRLVEIPGKDLQAALRQNYTFPTTGRQVAEAVERSAEEKVSGLLPGVEAFGYGGLRAITLGGSKFLEPEGTDELLARRPGAAFVGEAVGTLATAGVGATGTATSKAVGLLPGTLLGRAAERVGARFGEKTLARGLVTGAVDAGGYATAQAVTDMLAYDRPLTSETLTAVATATLFGGGLGAAVTGVGRALNRESLSITGRTTKAEAREGAETERFLQMHEPVRSYAKGLNDDARRILDDKEKLLEGVPEHAARMNRAALDLETARYEKARKDLGKAMGSPQLDFKASRLAKQSPGEVFRLAQKLDEFQTVVNDLRRSADMPPVDLTDVAAAMQNHLPVDLQESAMRLANFDNAALAKVLDVPAERIPVLSPTGKLVVGTYAAQRASKALQAAERLKLQSGPIHSRYWNRVKNSIGYYVLSKVPIIRDTTAGRAVRYAAAPKVGDILEHSADTIAGRLGEDLTREALPPVDKALGLATIGDAVKDTLEYAVSRWYKPAQKIARLSAAENLRDMRINIAQHGYARPDEFGVKGDEISERMAEVRAIAQNPEVAEAFLEEQTLGLQLIAPEVGQSIVDGTLAKFAYLDSKIPKQPFAGFKAPPMSPQQKSEWAWRRVAADNPFILMSFVEAGKVNMAAIETVRDLYPQLYSQMQMAVLETVASLGAQMPYVQRIAASQTFGLPLDLSMTGDSLAYHQAGPGVSQADQPIERGRNPPKNPPDQHDKETKAQRLTE